MTKETRKEIERLLKDTEESLDLIALKTNVKLVSVKRIEKIINLNLKR